MQHLEIARGVVARVAVPRTGRVLRAEPLQRLEVASPGGGCTRPHRAARRQAPAPLAARAHPPGEVGYTS